METDTERELTHHVCGLLKRRKDGYDRICFCGAHLYGYSGHGKIVVVCSRTRVVVMMWKHD